MVEICLLRTGEDKLRVLHTNDTLAFVSDRVDDSLKNGKVFWCSHLVGPGTIFVSADLLRTCVVTVREVEQPSTTKVQ